MSELNYPGDTASFPANNGVYQVQPQPQGQQERRGKGIGAAFAVALTTALVAGGGARYLAGSSHSDNAAETAA